LFSLTPRTNQRWEEFMAQGKSYGDASPICSTGRSGSDRRLDNKSRMSREAHVRFCESLGVKLPRATRPPRSRCVWAARKYITMRLQSQCRIRLL